MWIVVDRNRRSWCDGVSQETAQKFVGALAKQGIRAFALLDNGGTVYPRATLDYQRALRAAAKGAR